MQQGERQLTGVRIVRATVFENVVARNGIEPPTRLFRAALGASRRDSQSAQSQAMPKSVLPHPEISSRLQPEPFEQLGGIVDFYIALIRVGKRLSQAPPEATEAPDVLWERSSGPGGMRVPAVQLGVRLVR